MNEAEQKEIYVPRKNNGMKVFTVKLPKKGWPRRKNGK